MAHLIGSAVRWAVRAGLVAGSSIAVAACTNAETPPLSRYDQAAIAAGRGPLDTGTYPNLNIPQKGAAPQFSNQERDAKLAALRAEQQRQAPGSTETAEQRQRRLQLLTDEQEDTLEAIEGN